VHSAERESTILSNFTISGTAPSKKEVARRWQAKLAEFDAFIFATADYNHGPAAVLKNALDYA